MYIKKSKIPKKHRKEILGDEAEISSFEEGVEIDEIQDQFSSEPAKKSSSKKMKKEKKQISKKSKILYGVAVFLVVCAISVTLAITFWPVDLNSLYSQFNQSSQTFSTQSEEMKTFEKYKIAIKPFFDEGSDYMIELDSFSTFALTQNYSQRAFEEILSVSIEGKITNKTLKEMISNLENASEKIDQITSYIDEHMAELTNQTTVLASWENVRILYKEMVKEYVSFYEKFNQSIQELELKGFYGNDFLKMSILASYEFVSSFSQELFLNEETDLEKAVQILNVYEDFAERYFKDDNKQIIKNYLFDEESQKEIKNIKTLFEKTEGEVDFDYLINNNYNYSSLSAENQILAKSAEEFLKGGLN